MHSKAVLRASKRHRTKVTATDLISSRPAPTAENEEIRRKDPKEQFIKQHEKNKAETKGRKSR